MHSIIYENLIRSWGYHGVYVEVSSRAKGSSFCHAWDTSFWKGEYQIKFSIHCNTDLSYEDIKQDFLKVLIFAGTESAKNITSDDDIEGLLKLYLTEEASFDSIQSKEAYQLYFATYRNEIEYRIYISMNTEEDYSLDKYEEDHDEVLEQNKKEIVQLLEEKGLRDFEVEVAPDFLSVKVSIPYNHKIHHLDIHAFYDDWLYMWSADAAYIIDCYWRMLTDNGVNIGKFIKYLHQYRFFEIDSSKNDTSNFLLFAYRRHSKYRINVNIENQVIPFDNMEGHAFERFCADVLVANGFERIRVTQGSGDQGVDVIAYKDGVKYGVQCKCYSSDIGNRAVQEAYAGKAFYDCHVGVVLTNQHFTKSAVELAKKNGIILWDREKLQEFIKKATN